MTALEVNLRHEDVADKLIGSLAGDKSRCGALVTAEDGCKWKRQH